MVEPFDGQVAIVTGGSSGIGKASALAFARAGAKVVIASRNVERGADIAHLIARSGGDAIFVPTDVTQAAQVEAMVRTTIGHYGRLDFAFNNAGSGGGGGPIADCPEETWDQVMAVYLKGVWLCMKYEIPAMLKRGQGAIVNNASVDGLRAFPLDAVYCAAKHGVIGLTRSAALQYVKQGLRINAVCPGATRTPPMEEFIRHVDWAEKTILSQEPIGRLGEPEEIAEAVVWLCSGAASFVVGHALVVDGGYLL